MAVEKVVLVVSPTPSVAQAAASSVRQCGYVPVVVRSFADAKHHLGGGPHLLVTELKLGEYNGLHLALRARANDIPSIVIADEAFEHEVEQNGAAWMSPALAMSSELTIAMTTLVQGPLASEGASGWEHALTAWHPSMPSISH